MLRRLILKRNISSTTACRASDYPTRSPYDIPKQQEESLAKEQDQKQASQHHFDTFQIVEELSSDNGLQKSQASVIMKGMKFKLRESLGVLHQQLLLKSDLENESYLFKAAISELRTEIQVMRQKDTQQLKAETLMITREVEQLGQRIREDVDFMKNEIALEMNNRRNETRSDHKEIDMTIQELNNKFTVKLGEVKTGLESTRWETIWKGLAGVAGSGMILATFAYFLTNYADKRAEDQRLLKHKRKKEMQEEARHAGLADMEAVYSS